MNVDVLEMERCVCVCGGGGVHFLFSWYKMSSSSFCQSLIKTESLLTLSLIHIALFMTLF